MDGPFLPRWGRVGRLLRGKQTIWKWLSMIWRVCANADCRCSRPSRFGLRGGRLRGVCAVLTQVCLELPWDSSQDEWAIECVTVVTIDTKYIFSNQQINRYNQFGTASVTKDIFFISFESAVRNIICISNWIFINSSCIFNSIKMLFVWVIYSLIDKRATDLTGEISGWDFDARSIHGRDCTEHVTDRRSAGRADRTRRGKHGSRRDGLRRWIFFTQDRRWRESDVTNERGHAVPRRGFFNGRLRCSAEKIIKKILSKSWVNSNMVGGSEVNWLKAQAGRP